MRTTKFRGLRTDGKGWAYGNYQSFIGESEMRTFFDTSSKRDHKYEKIIVDIHLISVSIMPDEQGWDYSSQIRFIEVIPETVGQFTGLKDRNGKDIYEGDIVECKKTTNKYSYKFTSVVTMQYGCFGIITDRFITLKDLIEGNIKIIGNIHELPELLNN